MYGSQVAAVRWMYVLLVWQQQEVFSSCLSRSQQQRWRVGVHVEQKKKGKMVMVVVRCWITTAARLPVGDRNLVAFWFGFLDRNSKGRGCFLLLCSRQKQEHDGAVCGLLTSSKERMVEVAMGLGRCGGCFPVITRQPRELFRKAKGLLGVALCSTASRTRGWR